LKAFLERFRGVDIKLYNFNDSKYYVEFRVSMNIGHKHDVLDGTRFGNDSPLFYGKETATAEKVIDETGMYIESDSVYLVDRPEKMLIKKKIEKIFPFDKNISSNSYKRYKFTYGPHEGEYKAPIEDVYKTKFEQFVNEIDPKYRP
jgi:hypothetical protein